MDYIIEEKRTASSPPHPHVNWKLWKKYKISQGALLYHYSSSEHLRASAAYQHSKLIAFVHLPYQCYLLWYLEGSYNFFKEVRQGSSIWPDPLLHNCHIQRGTWLTILTCLLKFWLHSFSDCLSACSLQVAWYNFIRFPNSRWIQVNISGLWQKLQN